MKTPLDHYAPHLDGVERRCAFCPHETTFLVPGTTVRWCGQCGAIHLDSPFRCLPSVVGLERAAPGVPEVIRDQGPDPMKGP